MSDASSMVVHIAKRGRDLPGLAKYLYGPGRADEHRDQHMVAGSGDLTAAWAGALEQQEAGELGHYVEASWRTQTVEKRALARVGNGDVSRSAKGGTGGQHVYHMIVSLPPENRWDDEQWKVVADELVKGMGFTDGPDDEKGCRWFAMRHGLSAGGNDHMHIVVNRVRQDGRWADIHDDFKRVQQVRRDIEQKHDFVLPLHDPGVQPGRSLPAYQQAEHQQSRERAQQSGQEVPDRILIRQIVRAAAHSSATEQAWIHAVLDGARDVELDVARWSPGGTEVTGYKIRLGEGLWFSPTQFDRSLTLGKLREQWAPNETDESRAAAARLWRGEAEPDEATPVDLPDEYLATASALLAEWNDELDALDPHDRAAWHAASHDSAGFLSALSRTPGEHGEVFAVVADELTRDVLRLSEVAAPRAIPSGPRPSQVAARNVITALRAGGPNTHSGWVAVLQQISRTMAAIEAAKLARGELAAARTLRMNATTVLANVTTAVQNQAPQTLSERELAEARAVAKVTRHRAVATPRSTDGSRESHQADPATRRTRDTERRNERGRRPR